MSDTEARNSRKVRVGVVTSISGAKSITVKIDKKLHAHDENEVAHVGDTVKVMETRPLSKTKRWRLVEVVEAAK